MYRLYDMRFDIIVSNLGGNFFRVFFTPFNQLLPTRICFTNADVNSHGAKIRKVRKRVYLAFPAFLFPKLFFRMFVYHSHSLK